MNVRFIDTSVLLNLLGVPNRCQEKELIAEEFRQAIDSKELLILPYATIIETGNHIAHITDGRLRRSISQKFSAYLEHTANETAPWVFYQKGWDKETLRFFVDNFEEYALHKVGIGDLSIIHAYEQYKRETPSISSIMIWSTDQHLAAYKEHRSLNDRRR